MASSYSWKPSDGQAPSPRHETRSARSGGAPGGRLLAVLPLGLLAALACVASVLAGATRDDSSADDASALVAPSASVPGGSASAAPVSTSEAADNTSSSVPGPVWQTDYGRALARAAARKRPVLLRFTAAWCPPCQVMDRSVFPDRNVQAALAEQVVPVLLDIDEVQNAELAWHYKVRGVPTLLLINPDGAVLDRGGFMSAEALVKFLRGS